MRPEERVNVAAGGAVTFAPGGRHLMLMGPHRKLRAGDSVPVELEFEGGRLMSLQISVRKTRE